MNCNGWKTDARQIYLIGSQEILERPSRGFFFELAISWRITDWLYFWLWISRRNEDWFLKLGLDFLCGSRIIITLGWILIIRSLPLLLRISWFLSGLNYQIYIIKNLDGLHEFMHDSIFPQGTSLSWFFFFLLDWFLPYRKRNFNEAKLVIDSKLE